MFAFHERTNVAISTRGYPDTEVRSQNAALEELWESRRGHGRFGDCEKPVMPSTMTRARARVNACVFWEMHAEILAFR